MRLFVFGGKGIAVVLQSCYTDIKMLLQALNVTGLQHLPSFSLKNINKKDSLKLQTTIITILKKHDKFMEICV